MKAIRDIELHIALDSSTPGAIGGIQTGAGAKAEVKEWQTMNGSPATFVTFAKVRDGQLPLVGETIQKDSKGRFLYIVWRDNVGVISRRAKIYVESISQEHIDLGCPLAILVPGKAKDGLPCCATVKPLRDWHPLS